MKSQQIGDAGGGATGWIVTLEPGDEVIDSLTRFGAQQGPGFLAISGLGAFSEAVLAFYDRATFEYQQIPVDQQVEVLSIVGNVTRFEDAPRTHVHVSLSRPDGSMIGGHLLSAQVWPTLELSITRWPGEVRREFEPTCGLPIIQPAG